MPFAEMLGKDIDISVKKQIIDSLGKIRGEQAYKLLTKLFADCDKDLRPVGSRRWDVSRDDGLRDSRLRKEALLQWDQAPGLQDCWANN